MRATICFVLALATIFVPVSAAEKASTAEVQEWPVPWPDTHPTSPFYVAPDAVWFAGQTSNCLGMLNPKTGVFERINMLDRPAPTSLVVAANGLVWFAGTARGYIGRYDPRTRSIWHAEMPNAAASDPYTLMLELGERNIWFSVRAGNILGRLRIENGVVDLMGLRTANAMPGEIASAASGTPWFALSGTNAIAAIDPRTFTLTEQALPRASARLVGIGFTSNGRLWYVDSAEGYLGSFTPETKAVKEWALPGGKSGKPAAMAVDSHDHVWVAEVGSQPSKLIGFDPVEEHFFKRVPVSSASGAINSVRYARGTGQIWFTTDKAIGYAKVD